MQINKSAPECKKFLLTLMDSLENVRKLHDSFLSFKNHN